jgi:hypothetical protein
MGALRAQVSKCQVSSVKCQVQALKAFVSIPYTPVSGETPRPSPAPPPLSPALRGDRCWLCTANTTML